MRIFPGNFLFLGSQMFRVVLNVALQGVITLFRGLGLLQLLVLMLLLSGLWGPLLRSMYNKRKSRVKASIYIGEW